MTQSLPIAFPLTVNLGLLFFPNQHFALVPGMELWHQEHERLASLINFLK